MRLDISYLHEDVPPEEIGGYVRTALIDDQHPFVHIPKALPVRYHGSSEEAKQYVERFSQSIGELAVLHQSAGTVEEVNDARIGYSFHTDRPYIQWPERFVGLFALRAAPEGTRLNLLKFDDFLNWALLHPEHKEKVAEILNKPAMFRWGNKSTHRRILHMAVPIFRFDTAAFQGRKAEWGRLVSLVFNQAAEASQSVALNTGDAVFFNNHTQLHRMEQPANPPEDRQIFLKTRIRAGDFRLFRRHSSPMRQP